MSDRKESKQTPVELSRNETNLLIRAASFYLSSGFVLCQCDEEWCETIEECDACSLKSANQKLEKLQESFYNKDSK